MAVGDVLYCNGFDALDPTKDGLTAQTVTGGTITESASQAVGAWSASALRINRTGAAALSYRIRTATDTPPLGSTPSAFSYVIQFYFASLPASGDVEFLWSYNTGAGAGDVQITCNSSGQIKAKFFGQTAQNVGAAISAGGWHRLEVQCDFSATTWAGACRLDGGSPVTDTKSAQTAGDTLDRIQFGTTAATSSNYDVYLDDLVVVSGATWPGAYKVPSIKPDSAASELDTNWTIGAGSGTRAAVIDETPGVAPNDATDHIASSTSGQAQRVEMTSYTLGVGETLKAVQTVGRVGSTATTGTRTVAVNLQNAAGTDGSASTWSASINGWRPQSVQRLDLLDPAGAAWGQSSLDGIRLRFVKSATADAVRVSAAWCYLAVALSGALGNESWGAVPA